MESSQNITTNEEGSKTTIKLSNIKRNLSSELIHKILEKIFTKKRTYNAIYTLKKEYHKKNIGICYINFINSIYIKELANNLKEFGIKNKEDKINIEYAKMQGNEFIRIIQEKRGQQPNLDFIVFSDY